MLSDSCSLYRLQRLRKFREDYLFTLQNLSLITVKLSLTQVPFTSCNYPHQNTDALRVHCNSRQLLPSLNLVRKVALCVCVCVCVCVVVAWLVDLGEKEANMWTFIQQSRRLRTPLVQQLHLHCT